MVAHWGSETYVTWLAINGKGHELSSYILKHYETVLCHISLCVLSFSKEGAGDEERDFYLALGDVKCSE